MALPTIHENIDLQSFNTFGIHATAHYFTTIRTLEDITFLLNDTHWKGFSKFILGGGSNILFTEDYEGLIIKNEIMGIECIAEDTDFVWLKVGAGENWHSFVLYCIEQGYAGVENLSLIPGTVGAAPIQNIGAYGVELKDIFHNLEAVRIEDGNVAIFNHKECQFAYRDSIFKKTHRNQYIIANITLRLSKKPMFNLTYGAIKEVLHAMDPNKLTLKAVSDAVIQIRRSKLPDPKFIGNAGSFFKNPIISHNEFLQLQRNYSNIPFFSEDSLDLVKVPAGWLIEQCGWKGKRVGDIGVYDKQALVIVNYGRGTGAAIQELAQKIQESVYERFGLRLIPEVNIIGKN